MKVVSLLESGSFLVFSGLEFASEKYQNTFKNEGNIFFLHFFLGLEAAQESAFQAAGAWDRGRWSEQGAASRGRVAEWVIADLVGRPEVNIPPPEVVMLFREAHVL